MFSETEDSHDHQNEDSHDHAHNADGDVIAISIIDFLILILCILILIHFTKYMLNKKNYNFNQSVKDKDNLFRIGDIICLTTIILYGITIIILIAHDILHFSKVDSEYYHVDLGITQWILFLIARIMLQISFAYKLYSTFCGSAMSHNNYVYIILSVAIFGLFVYGMYIVILMGINEDILSPLSHNFTTILLFTAADFALIMVIAYLFVSKLYSVMKLMNADSSHSNTLNDNQMGNDKTFLNAISKYSLLTVIISIVVIIQLISLWFISIYYDHDEEHTEYLQHCVSTVVIFIDVICLYLSCRLTKSLYNKICKYPHKCCNKLCKKAILINYRLFNSDEIQMRKMQTANSSQLSVQSPSPSPTIAEVPNTPT